MYKTLSVSTVGLLLVLAISSLGVQGVEFTDCGDGNTIGNYSLVEVSNCNLAEPTCLLKRNTNATISITFTADEEVPELKAVVHGIIAELPIPFKLPNDDGCKDSGVECPLAAGTEYKYSTTLFVAKQYPKMTLKVKWELKSGDKDVICVIIPSRIQ